MDDSLDRLVGAIEKVLEDFSWLFLHMKKNKDSLSLPTQLIDFFCNIKYPDWASFYESQQKIDAIPLLYFFEPEDLKQLAEEIRLFSPDEVRDFRKEVEIVLIDMFSEIDATPFDFEWPTQMAIDEYLQATSLEQKQKDLLKAYLLFANFVIQTFQFLALATHGKTMHDLVTEAIAGDDLAFCQAVQIDRTVLFAVPHFRQRLLRMQLGHERNLLSSLGRAMSGKLWGNRFPNPEMWVVFSILHRDGRLKTMSLDQLLDVCVKLKVYKGSDTNTISKRKNDFLKRQGRIS